MPVRHSQISYINLLWGKCSSFSHNNYILTYFCYFVCPNSWVHYTYSASLVFILAEKYPEYINGILSFSPGEYMRVEDRKVEDFAKNIKCPVFITSTKSEESSWKSIYEKIPSENKAYYLPDFPGRHGSSALWDSYDKSSFYWEHVKKFLKKL